MEYGILLAEGIDAFRNVQTPIQRPMLSSGDGGKSTGASAGITVVTVAVTALVAGLV